MTVPPSSPKIYHITHVDNLVNIVKSGGLLSDATIAQRGGPVQTIGMSGIKQRRINDLEVPCHPGTKVGEYVPFYFCARSVMLVRYPLRQSPRAHISRGTRSDYPPPGGCSPGRRVGGQ